MGVVHTSRGVLSRGWRFVLLTNLVVDTTHPGTATIRFKGGAGAKAPTLPRRIPPERFVNPLDIGHYIDQGQPSFLS